MKFLGRREHVVVIGGGYAGLSCALDLSRRNERQGRGEALRVTLVSREGRQELTNELFRCLRTGAPELFDFRPLLKKHDIRFVEGQATEIDPVTRSLSIKGATRSSLVYDSLVVATGAHTGLPLVEGLSDLLQEKEAIDSKIFLFRNNAQAQSLRFSLRRWGWSIPGSDIFKRDFFVVVLGGGARGLEVAGEIAAMRGKNRHARVVLVDQKAELMPSFSPIAQKLLKKELARMQIETVLGSPAHRIESRELHIGNGQVIPWDLLVVCAGSRTPSPFLQAFGETAAAPDGLRVSARCEIPRYPRHYAIGSAAFIPRGDDPLSNARAWPRRSHFAAQAGRYLAGEIVERLQSNDFHTEQRPFQPHDYGFLVSLGPYNGIGRVGQERSSRGARLLSPFVVGAAVDKLKAMARSHYLAQLKWGIP